MSPIGFIALSPDPIEDFHVSDHTYSPGNIIAQKSARVTI